MNGSTAAAELPGVCWEVGLFVRIKQNNRSMVYSDSPRCGPSAHLFLPLDLFFKANCCQITQEENAQLYIPAPGSLLWLLMSTPAVHLLWSCKCLLMASIRQVVGGGVVCVRLCVCVSVCVCARMTLTGQQQFHHALAVMDQPHAATHLPAAGVKKQSTHVRRHERSGGILQGWCNMTGE